MQSETTSCEFLDWIEFLDDEERRRAIEEFRREDYYYAAIIAEVRRSWVKNPERVKLEDHLLRFAQGPATEPVKRQETREEATARARAFFLGALGLLKEKK